MPLTPYFVGVAGFSSMLILAMVTRPFISVAMSSRKGAICLHGAHHSAQKSTSTGPGARSTSASKDASVVLLVMLVFSAPKLAYRPFTDRKSRDIEAAARYFHED